MSKKNIQSEFIKECQRDINILARAKELVLEYSKLNQVNNQDIQFTENLFNSTDKWVESLIKNAYDFIPDKKEKKK